MRYALRWWETLGKSERIVAMSLAAGSVVAITNSTVWAIAASYMVRQRARVAIAGYAHVDEPPTLTAPDATNDHFSASTAASALSVR